MEAVKYKVLNTSGKEVGSIDLDAEVFGAKIQANVVHETVRWQRSKARSGNHSCLSKGMMKGGNRKPFKQKHTGRARAGSNTSPLWVGGAKAHGPHPHSHEFRLSKRTRRQALASVLSDKVKKNTLVILDDLKLGNGKTKEMVAVLKNLGLSAKKLTVVMPVKDAGVWRGAGNIPNVMTLPVNGVNVYDLLKRTYLVCTKEGVRAIEQRFKGE